MSELTPPQQEMVLKLLVISAMFFMASIGFLLWAYFRWGFK